MSFNPMGAPPVAAKGGKNTLYIVLFFICVISVMAGSFYFMNQSQDTKSARDVEKIQAEAASKMKDATRDFEKKQIQAEAAEKTRAAQRKAEFTGKEAALEARAKGREAQLKALEGKVSSELAAAAKTVKSANELKAKAASERNAAATRLREAEAAKKKADASGKPNDKKLADEKAKLTAAANAKVADVNKKATDAANKAKAVAAKALNLKKALDKAKARAKYNARVKAKAKARARAKAKARARAKAKARARAKYNARARAKYNARVKGKKLKRCKGKWSKWTGCGTNCIATKTWTTTGTKKGCRSPTIKSGKCTAKHSYRCAPGYVPKDMKRGKPGEAQAEALAKRKAKWDAGAEKRAASQARIDALVANFDPEADKKRAAAPRSQIRCSDSDGNPYFAWSCKAGDSKW
jgi:hypothetical protein